MRLVNFLQWDFNNMVFLRRAAHPAYGLSPVTPLVILVAGLLLWGYSNLQSACAWECVPPPTFCACSASCRAATI